MIIRNKGVSVNENQVSTNKDTTTNKTSRPVTSPISQGKLVSKVNALTSSSVNSSLINPHNISFNADKGSTLNYKFVVDELVKLASIDNTSEFYNKIHSIILQSIDSTFMAIGLFKEKSNCINLKLQDKLGNCFSTKVFLKDSDNPIVQVFNERTVKFVDKKDYLKLSYYKNYSTAILPLISVNKCIGVLIIEDSYARQNSTLYSLIANCLALVTHHFFLIIPYYALQAPINLPLKNIIRNFVLHKHLQ